MIRIIINTNNRLLKVKVIIDLSVTGNFILKDLAKRKRFSRNKKKDLYNIIIINRNIL